LKYILLRSLQIFSMILILSGLAIGIRDKNVMLELNALIIGSGIFFLANKYLGGSK
jgi:hypothetical protein